MSLAVKTTHPKGESLSESEQPDLLAENTELAVETFGGRVHVEWDPQAAVTPLGQLPFFIEFLKLGNLFEPWVNECPLQLTSPNAPANRDVLGTLLLSVLAGHTRYAHISALRGDGVNLELLGMKKIVSEDSMRRYFLKMEEMAGIKWLQQHLHQGYAPLLTVPMAASYSAPDLWQLLERLPRHQWPQFLRGDCNFGTDAVMRRAEANQLPYLFKLKGTQNVKRLIERLMVNSDWESAGQGWTGQDALLQLQGWHSPRRVVVLRKPVSAVGKQITHAGQTCISISSTHGKMGKVKSLLNRIARFFKTIKSLAEQLTAQQRWYLILSKAVEKYLCGGVLQPPDDLPAPV